ncbi:MATE family efflux transporter [Leucothrix arctica]|uniref:MATE family efflux transporter n=1 Tax=Leucothrix arctica TaxID=1481894 RepID=A0A317CEX1_9GAMM|nr:MATE family efflux transporter [Leucothrix arctica]PWQ97066.1 hypothetical protein DKT75_07655 [Leucothrix arctica]
MSQALLGNRNVFSLAWPIAINAILLQFILVIDTVLITPLGEESLAAMGLAASVAGILVGLLMAFSNGTQLVVAQAFGAKSPLALSLSFRSGAVINAMIACAGILFIFIFGKSLISLISDKPLMIEMSYDYLKIFSVVVFGVSVSQNITVYFNATGRSRIPMYANFLELPINVAVSVVLIYGLLGFTEMGLEGAAVGSAVAVSSRALFLVVFYSKQQAKQIPFDAPALTVTNVKDHARHATPIAGTFISSILAAGVCMMIYAKLSTNEFAALVLIAPWIKVAGHLSTAWGQSTGILAGQLLGNKDWPLLDGFVSRSWRAAFVVATVISIAYISMFFLFEALYPELEEETLNALWLFAPILGVTPFIRTSNTICGHVLRAGGDAKYVLKIHAYTQWFVIVPLSALFVLYWDLHVVWVFALTLLEEIIKSVPFHLRMYSDSWKKNLVTA